MCVYMRVRCRYVGVHIFICVPVQISAHPHVRKACARFIRSVFDLRQFLGRAPPLLQMSAGWPASREGWGVRVRRADGEDERWDVRGRKERIDR